MEELNSIKDKFFSDCDKFIKEIKDKSIVVNKSIVVYKDMRHFCIDSNLAWEFETDKDYLLTIELNEDNLKKIDYKTLNK